MIVMLRAIETNMAVEVNDDRDARDVRAARPTERGKPLCARVVYFEIRVRVGLRLLQLGQTRLGADNRQAPG